MLYKKIAGGLLAAAMLLSLAACSYRDLEQLLQQLPSSEPVSAADPPPASSDSEQALPVPSAEPAQSGETDLRFFWSKNNTPVWQDDFLAGETYYEFLYLRGEDVTDGPFLSHALAVMNEEIRRRQLVSAAEIQEHTEQVPPEERQYQGIWTQRVSVQRADQQVLSILRRDEIFTSVSVQTLNLDPVTGEPLTLADVFRDPEEVLELLEERLETTYKAAGKPLEERIRKIIKQDAAQGDLRWIVGYQNVTFILPPAMDPYLSELLFFPIWFDESPSLFQERFLSVPSRYVLRLMPGVPLEIDLDSADGRRNYFLATSETDEFGAIRLELTVNGRTYPLLPDAELAAGYDADLYLVYQADGNHLLYLDTTTENRYHALTVYRLRDMQLLQRFWNLGFYEGIVGHERIKELFVTPSRFTLYTTTELLGTMWGVCDFRVDPSSGLPVESMPYFDILPSGTLTTKRPVKADRLPEQTGEQIPAGTELTALRTDCLHYVDVSAQDGREWRIWVDASRWPATVDGIPADECFDGMLYAG